VNSIQHRYILFLRHGEALGNPFIFLSDYEKSLSTKGEQQAEEICELVRKFNPDSIFCSPFLRAQKTAEIACKKLQKITPIQMDQDLVERTFPMLYGKSRKEIASIYSQEVVEKLSTCTDQVEIPGSESLEEAQMRIISTLQKILERGATKILIVSHGGPHSWLCCHYRGLDLSHNRSFTLNEGHISLFQFDQEGKFEKILLLNARELPSGWKQ
jgi:broad specificity phosphatase PhoE